VVTTQALLSTNHPVRRPLPALQLRPGVAERLVENDGRLELTDIADAMWDSVQRRKETRR
jgi:hypothetical protein